MNKKTFPLINVFSTITLQIVTLLSGFIVPKLILDAFGSEINGLISSITQFLGYISLIEGGVSSVILANLYIPLATKDIKQVSAVVTTADAFFKKIALIFGIYQIVLAIVYPFFVDSKFSWAYIASMVMLLGISTIIQYTFALSWRLLLQADNCVYIASLAQGVAVVLNLIITYIVISVVPNVHLVKLISGIAFCVQPLILNRYICKNYKLDKNVVGDSILLSQRWDGFGINVASMIHASTATVVLSIAANLSTVSVFSVYMLVANGLKSLITSISSGIVPSLGNAYAQNNMDRSNRIFSLYDFVMFVVSFFCFTVAAVTISSFALLYTLNITDANYKQPILGLLLMAAECIFCIRDPYVNMAYSAGHFRQVSKYAYIEAVINILCSVVFAILWGMNGVALGLLISVIYRTFAQVLYLKKNILKRRVSSFIRIFASFSSTSVVCIVFSNYIWDMPELTVISWIIYALKVSLVEISCLLVASLICCRSELKLLKSFIVRIRK